MHSLKDKTVLIAPTDRAVINGLRELGINIIESKSIEQLIEYEKYHADMQLLIVDDMAFISRDSLYLKQFLNKKYKIVIVDSLGKNYPDNIALNALRVSDKLICKEDSVAPQVIEYARNQNIEIINTNQGYSRCSALALNSGAIITADPSIYNTSVKSGIKSLLISSGSIYLDENTYGFIGGASGVIGDTVLFFGDINTHPDGRIIVEFIENEGMNYISLCNGVLKDIGGLVLIK